MKVIRKVLTSLELIPADLRYNPDCDCVERSPDGGTTWVESPGEDPRHSDGYRLPPLTGENARCDAAARIVHAFQDNLHIFHNSVNAAQYATGIMSIFLRVPFGIGIIIGVALLVFDRLIEIGQETIEAAFTPEVWDGIECIIYCHIGEDGQVSVAQRDAIMADIATQYPGTVYATLVNVVNLFGEVLMSNAGVEYDDVGDCDECDCEGWCQEFDFRDGLHGFTLLFGTTRVAGVGLHGGASSADSTYAGKAFGFTFDVANITVFIDTPHALDAAGTNHRICTNDTGAACVPQTFGLDPDGHYFALDGAFTISSLSFGCERSGEDTSFLTNITKVRLSSPTGTNPFGSDNCEDD